MALYCYDPVGAVPVGEELRDAASVLPRERFFRSAHGPHKGSAAGFANLFRYAMILDTGLIWVDTDVVCLNPDWPERPVVAAFQDEVMVNNAVLGGSAAAPLLERALEIAARVGTSGPWAYTGPHLITALANEMGYTRYVLPRDAFYPLSYGIAAKALLSPYPEAQHINWPQQTLAVHLWNEMLRLAGYDKRQAPPEHSLLKLILADLGD